VATAKLWRFEQLGGLKKVLELSGWAAPHGRPRQDAVVRDGVEIRKAEYHYPGAVGRPTRHVFGATYLPWELQGRFRDRSDGQNFAKAKREELKAFVLDAQRVRISWGDILSVEGFLDKFDPGHESEGEVEWRLTCSIDVDLLATPPKRKVAKPVDVSYVSKLIAADMGVLLASAPHIPSTNLFDSIDNLLGFPSAIAGEFLEITDSLVSVVTGVAGKFQKAANSISNIEKATFGQLNRLATVSVQLQGAIAALKETYTNAEVDAVLLGQRASENLKFWSAQSAAEAAMEDILAQLGELNRVAQIQLLGRVRQTYVALFGDTWESISTKFYGGPWRAADLRDANDVGIGAEPVPGVEYVIPL